jgi:uncharacterized protein (TIGR01777 family)
MPAKTRMNRQLFTRSVTLPVPAQRAFAWHARPGALERLIPPWQSVRIVRRGEGIGDGQRVELLLRIGPFRRRWIAEHRDCRPGCGFRDVALRGPLAHWDHLHRFEPAGPHACRMEDRIEYALPGGTLGRRLAAWYVAGQLERTFRYRHDTTAADLAAHAKYADRRPLRICVTGSSGLVGSALIPFVTTGGHEVVRIVRGPGQPDRGRIAWHPQAGTIDADALEGTDAVVHLAGENVAAGRWTNPRKTRILDSRVQGTRTLCTALAGLDRPPSVLVSASAVGYYGHRGDEVLDEACGFGQGFLADVCRQWEAATEPARVRGIRVVLLRFGMILSPRGGALAKMLPAFRFCAGGRFGHGRQYCSWVSLDDAVGAIHCAVMCDSLEGPVNVAAPHPVTNAELAQTLASVLRRPAKLPVPASLARLAFGQMADELLLASIRAVPKRLAECDYVFRHPTLETALRHLLGSH